MKISLSLVGGLLILVLVLALDFGVEFSFFKTFIKIVKSAFDVNPAPQPGSNLRVCTGAVTWGDMCTAPLQPTLSWNVTSGTQTAYAVQVDNNGWLPRVPSAAFPSPEVDTGETPGASNSYTVLAGKLVFNTTYYWQIAVKDNFGSWSGWTEADSSFTTTSHLWPQVAFNYAPAPPSAGEVVLFADQTRCYSAGNVLVSCPAGAWTWNIQDATYEAGSSPASQNPLVRFISDGSKTVTLTVRDADGYTCSYTRQVGVRLPLPKWKEVAP